MAAIAEDLVLLSLDADGTSARTGYEQYVEYGASGALVAELVAGGHTGLDHKGRIRIVRETPPPDDPVLGAALDPLARKEGRRLSHVLGTLVHKAGRVQVVEALVQQGVLGRKKPSPFQPTRHPVHDRGRWEEVRDRLRVAATSDAPPDLRTGVVLALAGPCYLLEVVAPDRADHAMAKRRIAEAAHEVPEATAVRQAIEAMAVAVAAASSA